MGDDKQKPQQDPAEGSRKVIENELERAEKEDKPERRPDNANDKARD